MSQVIMMRKLIEVNTDPQRRCYNGCHFSSEMRWTEWGPLELLEEREELRVSPQERVEARLKFWRELNGYAVSQRGESAKCEFKAVSEEELS